jgi:DNA invertase Pin-like site-specific DNA recombinase
VIRPVYADALEDLKHGKASSEYLRPLPAVDIPAALDGIAVIEIDRLTRDNIDLEDAINVVVHHQRPIIDVTGTLDLLTDNGRDTARILVTMKGRQSADTARRVRDKHYAIALNGIPIDGNRPFGWKQDKRTLDPKESELLRQAAQLIIRRVGVTTIAKYWYEQGIRSPGGKIIAKRTLEVMLLSPRIVGWRVYAPRNAPLAPLHERYICDDNGRPVKGQHEPILDVETWQQVVSIMNSRSQPGNYIAGKRKYRLSGIMRCSECDKRLVGYAVRNGRFAYACKKQSRLAAAAK